MSCYFDFIVSGDDVKKAKPSTEIYERAAGMCDFESCYIVEDSDNGLKAAQIGDSRCRAVFYQGTQVFSAEPYAYRINDLRQLQEIVRRPRELRAFVPCEELKLEAAEALGDSQQEWQKEADAVWQKALEKRPELFNGGVMFFGGLEEKEDGASAALQIWKSEYKYYKWAMYRRDCGRPVPVMSMAVSGILLDPEGNTLLARRGSVTQYESLYELVPSGGLDAGLFEEAVGACRHGDAEAACRNGNAEAACRRGATAPLTKTADLTDTAVQSQILEELKQESAGSIQGEDIQEIKILGLSCDIPDQVLDICVLIRLNKSLKALKLCSNEEYDARSLQVIKADSILKEKMLCNQLVPTSIEMVKDLQAG